MRSWILTFILQLFISSIACADNLFETSPEYKDLIQQYKSLEASGPYAKLIPIGNSDNGEPMYLFILDKKQEFRMENPRTGDRLVYMINNGIHPGEPDGVNASLLFAKNLLADGAKKLPAEIIICIVPMMNVDGAENRGCCSRVNQDGPPEYGFRANALNLDLNRDFMKCEAQTTTTWIRTFHRWNPDILIDTHVSNGADYSYTMTLISSQKDKLYPVLGEFMDKKLNPALYKKMELKGEEMSPYVNTLENENVPDSGLSAFLESPRFLSGHAALFNTLSFTAETHMLKPFPKRVQATLTLLESMLECCMEMKSQILSARITAQKENQFRDKFPVNWTLDKSSYDHITFKGFQAGYKKSSVTGLDRLYYDRSKPYTKKIKYYGSYLAEDTISAPLFYIIPQSYQAILKKINNCGLNYFIMEKDSMMPAEVYYIDKYNTVQYPYEGKYLHFKTSVNKTVENVLVRKGDWAIPVFQTGSRYLIEALEPVATDSYFNWGFFDAILQQKEWFSAYVFEDIAADIISTDPALKKQLDKMKAADPAFASDGFAQLLYIYRQSPYFEKSYMRYPVYRIPKRQ